jgi:two-component system, response regulator YesN
MKAVIVDDEILVRAGMRTIIDWESLHLDIVGEASGSAEALEIARATRPDIMLVDVVMPGMNGLELIRVLRDEIPTCKFIVLSCKSETEYLKEAIRLGVKDYVLKDSISPAELYETFRRVTEEIRKERVVDDNSDLSSQYLNRDIALREHLNNALRGTIASGAATLAKLAGHGVRLCEGRLLVVAISCRRSEFAVSVLHICQNVVSDMTAGYIIRDYNDLLTAIVSRPDEVDRADFLANLERSCVDTVRQCLDVDISAGASREFASLDGLSKAYREAVAALGREYVEGPGHFFPYAAPSGSRLAAEDLEAIRTELRSIPNLLEPGLFEASLDRFSAFAARTSAVGREEARSFALEILYRASDLARGAGCLVEVAIGPGFDPVGYVDSAADFPALVAKLRAFLSALETSVAAKVTLERKDLAGSIMRYVDEHVEERIMLDDVAQHVCKSRSYVCTAFKRSTGERLGDYICRVKLERAQVLLLANARVLEVTERLGFYSESHFIKLFKTHFGTTPAKFAKSLGRSEPGH